MSRKKCNKCGEVKFVQEFYKNNKSIDGLGSQCKPCDKETRKKNYELMKLKDKPLKETKKCNVCKETKTRDNFHIANTSGDGLAKICIACSLKQQKFHMEVNRNKTKYTDEDFNITCSLCKQSKSKSNYYKNNTTTNGYSYRCKSCYDKTHYIYYRKWYVKNLEIILERHRKFKETFRGKEIGRLANYRRRMRLKEGNSEKYNQKDILQEFDYKCFKCGSTELLTYDHIIPISLNGDDTKHNISILCRSCNCSKGPKHPTKFYSEDKLTELENLKRINIPRI